MRLNVNGHLLPIRLKSEPETVHVHAHGLTLVFFADLRVISTEHTGVRCRNDTDRAPPVRLNVNGFL